ncbi:phosphopantetheine-binding protein [Actinoalloteichus sp. AHMU CJ021]|uniref:phosphopantetheine-binding protein n=1 Tax=Actinoalloteichus sp. AHMU CJ021 TaxID=2072503 RepID=UPI0026A5E31E
MDKVGVTDDFFHLGGNSVLSLRVVARIREAFDVDPTARALFDHPTVAGLADTVEELVIAEIENSLEFDGGDMPRD